MQNDKAILPRDVYYQHLTKINGVKFTSREVDVISCLLNRRTASISSFLLIGPRAVESNIRNIRQKAGNLSGRDNIIDFVEKSDKFSLIKNEYYFSLRLRVLFEEKLKEISKKFNIKSSCLLAYKKGQKYNPSLIPYLKEHLKYVGFILSEETISFTQLNENPNLDRINHVVYIFPQNLSDTQIAEINASYLSHAIFLFHQNTAPKNLYKNLKNNNYISMLEKENYYLSFFEILKKLLPHANLDSIIEEFKRQYELTNELSDVRIPEKNLPAEKEILSTPINIRFLKKKINYFLIGLIPVVITFGIFLFISNGKYSKNLNSPHKPESTIRSGLIIPAHTTLLNRYELMDEIDNKFKGQKGIQSVALVGIGGAGKTTLARQYAHQQKENIIWEVNAETISNLNKSFENLAYSLSKTEEDEKFLREIEEIKEETKREDKIIQFVREHLKSLPNWFLIFDNVYEFTDIQKYFPHDSVAWGEGKVILTTRNANIQNNTYINYTITIGELSASQKLSLFIKTMTHGNMQPLTPIQIEEAELFLAKLPSFPLDIVIAASYFRSINISFDKYLELISKESSDFINFEKILMRSIGDYAQTRHGIINLSLENIINMSEDFKRLLFFISLIDNQGIPIIILELIANKGSVDSFIYHLNKHSLITNMEFIDSLGVFSIHDTTHAAIKNFIAKVSGFPDKHSLLKFFASLMRDRMYATSYEETNLPQTKLLLNHCEKFVNSSELPPGELKQDILSEIGRAYFYLGDYFRSKRFLDESFLIYEKRKKEDSGGNENIRLLSFIGDLYGNGMLTGDFERDIDKLQYLTDLLEGEIHKISKKTSQKFLGEGYLYLSLFNTFLAHIKNENKIGESIAKICNQSCNQPEAENNLANFNPYFLAPDLEKTYIKAYDLAQQGLNIVLAEDKTHKRVGIFYHYMAYLSSFVKQSKEMDEKFKEMAEKGREIYKKFYTTDNIRMGWSSIMLGSLYSNLGLHREAQSLYEKGIAVYKKYYGSNHNQILFFENEIAYNLILLGKFDEAETILKENINKPTFQSNINIKKTIHLLMFLYQKMIDKNHEVSKNKILKSYYAALLCRKAKTQARLIDKTR